MEPVDKDAATFAEPVIPYVDMAFDGEPYPRRVEIKSRNHAKQIIADFDNGHVLVVAAGNIVEVFPSSKCHLMFNAQAAALLLSSNTAHGDILTHDPETTQTPEPEVL